MCVNRQTLCEVCVCVLEVLPAEGDQKGSMEPNTQEDHPTFARGDHDRK